VPTFFHLHLVSDSTGETLMTVARASIARYEDIESIEHMHPLVRSERQLERVMTDIEAAPGVVLFTLVDENMASRLVRTCRELGLPCADVLDPVVHLFQSYLNVPLKPRIGGQHQLDADYFRRIDALNFVLMHDDGALPDDIDEADVIIIGISRTSKTPTSIYLANRGIKATNLPIVPGIGLPTALFRATRPLIVGLVASPERIAQIRENRLLSLNAVRDSAAYVDRQAIAEEIAFTRRLCAEHQWPLIDVTRRSIEETAAAILALIKERRARAEAVAAGETIR
jgi:regulator of PEP synthase PpsR (kinase-PPPase family)